MAPLSRREDEDVSKQPPFINERLPVSSTIYTFILTPPPWTLMLPVSSHTFIHHVNATAVYVHISCGGTSFFTLSLSHENGGSGPETNIVDEELKPKMPPFIVQRFHDNCKAKLRTINE